MNLTTKAQLLESPSLVNEIMADWLLSRDVFIVDDFLSRDAMKSCVLWLH